MHKKRVSMVLSLVLAVCIVASTVAFLVMNNFAFAANTNVTSQLNYTYTLTKNGTPVTGSSNIFNAGVYTVKVEWALQPGVTVEDGDYFVLPMTFASPVNIGTSSYTFDFAATRSDNTTGTAGQVVVDSSGAGNWHTSHSIVAEFNSFLENETGISGEFSFSLALDYQSEGAAQTWRINSVVMAGGTNATGSKAAIIAGTKEITGMSSTAKQFTFLLTQVADANGTAMSNPYTATAKSNGAGRFLFGIEGLQPGTYYYRITEQGATGDNWTYDTSGHIVTVEVVANGSGGTEISINYGSTGGGFSHGASAEVPRTNPPTAYVLDPTEEFVVTHVGENQTNNQFTLSDGTNQFVSVCADMETDGPEEDDVYRWLASRDDSLTALAYAVAYPNLGAGLTLQEFNDLFDISVGSDANRFKLMNAVIWIHEYNGRHPGELSSLTDLDTWPNDVNFNHLRAHINSLGIAPTSPTGAGSRAAFAKVMGMLDDMMAAYSAAAAGDAITSLALQYNPSTSRLTFSHVGYEPTWYLTHLSWSGATTGLTVTQNGVAISSGALVSKTDDIRVSYTGSGTVTFTLTDSLYYLVGDSIQGDLLGNETNPETQIVIVGHAEFVTLANTLSLADFGAGGGITFSNAYTAPPIDVPIPGEKVVTGIGSTNQQFTFRITQVADEDGTPMSNPYTNTVSRNGPGTFTFTIPGLRPGTYYYRITEQAGPAGGDWTYDTNDYIVVVTVSDDGSGNLHHAVTFGNGQASGSSHSQARTTPAPPYNINAGDDYAAQGSGSFGTQFRISDGTNTYYGACADLTASAPSTSTSYTYQVHADRDNTESALIAAVMDVLCGPGLTLQEFCDLFGVTGATASTRFSYSQYALWAFESKIKYSSQHPNIDLTDISTWPSVTEFNSLKNSISNRTLFYRIVGAVEEMMDAYRSTPAGQPISSLALTYTAHIGSTPGGQITFEHLGYQPSWYLTTLSWSGDTTGLQVTKNGVVVSSGTSVKKTDVIMVTYTGSGNVTFTLTDRLNYLVQGSVKGDRFRNVSASGNVQDAVVGTAEFVTLESILSLTDFAGAGNIVFTNTFTPPPIDVPIPGEKIVTGIDNTNQQFTFVITQVADEDGTPMANPYTNSVTITGAGSFTLTIPNLPVGTYYYKITEQAGPAGGSWTYDTSEYIVVVTVVDDGSGTLQHSVTFGGHVSSGTPGSSPRVGPPSSYSIEAGEDYSLRANGTYGTQFSLSDGSTTYFGICSDLSASLPGSGTYTYQVSSDRNNTESALMVSLSDVLSGPQLTLQEFNALFGITGSGATATTRFYYSQYAVWAYEAKIKYAAQYPNVDIADISTWPNETEFNLLKNEAIANLPLFYRIVNAINDMMDADRATPAGESITSLEMTYTPHLGSVPGGRISFEHVGYQPVRYITTLSWSGDTTGLQVTKNGTPISSGASVLKTDVIMVTYTGTGSVTFTLTDSQNYLVAGSVEGDRLRHTTGSSYQDAILGTSEFVTLENTLLIGDFAGEGEIHFSNNYTAPPIDVEIPGNKEVEGSSDPDKTFTFILTQVADAHGTPMANPYTQTVTRNGPGGFSFTIPGLVPGTYYYKITEQAGTPGDGWIYDTNEYVIAVTVEDDGSGTLQATTSFNGNQSGIPDFVSRPSAAYNLDPNRTFRVITRPPGALNNQFSLDDGASQFVGVCADSTTGPPAEGDRYGWFANRDHSVQALAYALSSPNYGARLTLQEFNDLLDLNIDTDDNRFKLMNTVIWIFEEDLKHPEYNLDFTNIGGWPAALNTVRDRIDSIGSSGRASFYQAVEVLSAMLAASNNPAVPTGSGISALWLQFDSATQELTFGHTGYQPARYLTTLSWSGDVANVTVTKNGAPMASGDPVLKTDTIVVTYTGDQTVTFTLVDELNCLKAGSIEGDLLVNNTNPGTQFTIVGHAEFVQLFNNITLFRTPRAADLTFNNVYEPAKADAEITVTKEITGIDATIDQFTFIIEEVADVRGNPIANPFTDTQRTIGADQFTFVIPDLDVGVYVFRITEQAGPAGDGWTYDARVFYVVVAVTDDGSGQLRTLPALHREQEDDPHDVTFLNEYTADIDFEFIKTDRDGNPLPGATFELYACAFADEPILGHVHSPLATNDGLPACCWDVDHPYAVAESDPDGLVLLEGLITGDYMLVETIAPAPYALPHGQWLIQVNAQAGTISITACGDPDLLPPAFRVDTDSQGNVSYSLPNYPKFEMPHSGAVSGPIFTVAGAVLFGAAMLLWILTGCRKRKIQSEPY